MPQENSNIKEKSNLRIKEPSLYAVVFHNDDFTPMEFVTFLLQYVFNKEPLEAETLMLKVHHEGKAIVGSYSYDMAMTKTKISTDMARKSGFPLRITVEKI